MPASFGSGSPGFEAEGRHGFAVAAAGAGLLVVVAADADVAGVEVAAGVFAVEVLEAGGYVFAADCWGDGFDTDGHVM